ncbi:hypothetical protein GTZ97_14520 [Aquabacterium fontiphilum]|uniref:hypothetical protein n=1 Tax=Aquabacterium fontiphilum TaxID=450365 RepID=UPI0013772CFF|nr:hypothetical protein [Aquabacterium fontiphilum]NBD21872.1 hypothetical protein [Aquabacterium fontiphilum]
MAPKKNPVIYIGGPGYDQHFFEHFDPILAGISAHFEQILRKLRISGRMGIPVSIDLFVKASDPNNIEAFAEPIVLGSSYRIVLSAGLSYRLWLASRFVLTDYEYFSWVGQCKVLKREGTPSRKERLADFSFYIATYYILLHELAHIVLGHCDYFNKTTGSAVDEFGSSGYVLTPEQLRISRGLEAEADRQAGEWLLAFFEGALGPTGRGVDITFPSRVAAYEFYTYAITSVFVLFQQLTQRMGKRHPLPNERQYVVLTGIGTFLKRFKPQELDTLFPRVTLFMSDAGRRMGLLGAQTPLETAKVAMGMVYVDDVIKETKIRDFQHRVVATE